MSTPAVVKRRAEVSGQSKRHKPVVEVRAVPVDPALCGLEVIATAATACPRIAHTTPSAESSPTASSSPAPASLPGPSSLTPAHAHALTPHALTPHYSSTATQRRPWLQSEDDTIRRLVSVHGTRSWELVSQECPGRTGKQCRERWHNDRNQNINPNPTPDANPKPKPKPNPNPSPTRNASPNPNSNPNQAQPPRPEHQEECLDDRGGTRSP